MTPKHPRRPSKPPEKASENVGQRDERTHHDADRGKASIEPGKHDAKIGEDGVLTDESEAG
jgi:hypothetical protein